MRSAPYTPAGLLRRPCAHCGGKASHQWSLRPCAIGRTGWYALCTHCDVRLNKIVMAFLRLPDRAERLAAYALTASQGGEEGQGHSAAQNDADALRGAFPGDLEGIADGT